jgi:hypothetical protein
MSHEHHVQHLLGAWEKPLYYMTQFHKEMEREMIVRHGNAHTLFSNRNETGGIATVFGFPETIV